MPTPKSYPVHFAHPLVELGAIFIGENATPSAYITNNLGKNITKVCLGNLTTAFNFLEKIEPLNE